jgi:drug/metabolite transporter (DMT)-like permease
MFSAPPLWLIATLLSVLCASSGQILLKIGVRSAGLPPNVLLHPVALFAALLNPFIIGGIFAFVASMLLWLAAINGQQLSSVYPLAALGYVIVTLVSVLLFHDRITVWKVAGILLIVLGVALLNHGTSSTSDVVDPSVAVRPSR